MATLARMHVELEARTQAFNSAMDGAAAKVQAAGLKMKSVGRTLSAAVTLPLTAVGVAAVKMASDAEEAGNKFDVVMGPAADRMRERLQALTATIPITRSEMEAMSSGIQDMLVPMGVAREQAAGMSVDMVKLAGDLGSFNNVGTTEVLMAMQSALAGSSEPMRRFGVDTRVTRLEQLALSAGLIKEGQALDNTTTALAVMMAIQKDSTDAMGDAERTVTSTANSLKFFMRDVKQAGITIGQILIPAVTPMVQNLTEMIGRFQALSPAMQATIVKVGLVAAAIGPLLVVAGTLVTAIGALLPVIGTVVAAFATMGTALVALNPIVLGVVAVVAALTAAWLKWGTDTPKIVMDGVKKIIAPIQSIAAPIWAVVKALSGMTFEFVKLLVEWSVEVIKVISNLAKGIVSWLVDGLAPLARWFWDRVLRPLIDVFTAVAGQISAWAQRIAGFFRRLRGEAEAETDTMGAEVGGLFERMRNMVTGSVSNMASAVTGTFAAMKAGAVGAATETVEAVTMEYARLEIELPDSLKKTQEKVETGIEAWKVPLSAKVGEVVSEVGAVWAGIEDALAGVGLDATFAKSIAKWVNFADQVIKSISRIVKFLNDQEGGFFDFIGSLIGGLFGGKDPFGGGKGFNPGAGFNPDLSDLGRFGPEGTRSDRTRGSANLVITNNINFFGPTDQDGARQGVAEAMDESLGRLQRTATRDFLGDMTVTV